MGRVKRRLDKTRFTVALDDLRGFETEAFTVKSVTFLQSTLWPQGAVYSKLAEAKLTAS